MNKPQVEVKANPLATFPQKRVDNGVIIQINNAICVMLVDKCAGVCIETKPKHYINISDFSHMFFTTNEP